MSNRCEPYLSEDEYRNQLISGSIIRGVLHVNSKKPTDAFLKPFGPYMKSPTASDDLIDDLEIAEDDVIITGPVNRNRAIHGDIVGVRLKSRNECEQDATRMAQGNTSTDVSVLAKKEFGQVAFVEYQPGRGRWQTYYAVLRSNRPTSANNELLAQHAPNDPDFRPDLHIDWSKDLAIKAVPIDRRIPWLRIERAHVIWLANREKKPGPWTALINAKELPEYTIYEVKIVDWKENAALPAGNLVAEIGIMGVPEVEETIALKEAMLLDHRLPFPEQVEDFSLSVVKEATDKMAELQKDRVDLTKSRIFTIDPPTARDLDDAISINRCDGYLEIAVHIADVSHFVQAETPLDEVAKDRTTTVYLPHKAYHMLPRSLCEQACSLNTEGPRLAFTCVFAVDYNGTLLDNPKPRFFKSVIHSKYQLNYDQVQKILDQAQPEQRPLMQERELATFLVPSVDLSNLDDMLEENDDYPKADLVKDLVLLESITQKIREKRFDNGSLTLTKVQLRFHCEGGHEENDNPNAGQPSSLYVDKHTSSHQLIEELMLLANRLVARRLISSPLYQLAVCRYHPPMDVKKVEKVQEFMKIMNIECDLESSKGVQATLQLAYEKLGSRIGMAVEQVLIQGLQLAQYGAYGSSDTPGPYHYALAFSEYTHFTSPIRRYPDILVHRLLNIILDFEKKNITEEIDINDVDSLTGEVGAALQEYGYFNVEDLQKQCVRCNEKKECAKKAQEKASLSWLLMYLAQLPEPKGALATVMNVDDKSLDVFVNEMGLRRRVEYQTKGSLRIGQKLRKTYKDIVEIPSEYQILEPGKCVIRWEDGRSITVTPCSGLPTWILPTQDIPIDFLVLPIPPNHPEHQLLKNQDKDLSRMTASFLPLIGTQALEAKKHRGAQPSTEVS